MPANRRRKPVSRNDITGAEQKTKAATPEYREGHEKIFGNKKPQRGRWIQDPESGELIPASEYVSRETKAGMILVKGFDAYESPVSGEVISNHRQRDRDLKASGCRQYEGKTQELQEVAKFKAEKNRQLEQKVTNTLEHAYYEIEHGYRRVE